MSDNELSSNDSQCRISDDDMSEYPEEDMKFEVEESDAEGDDEEEEEEEEDGEEEMADLKCEVKDAESNLSKTEPDQEQSSRWTPPTEARLLSRMKAALSKIDDDNHFDSYVQQEMLDWDRIAFEPFSATECKDKWTIYSKNLRRFRFLAELVDEVASSQGVELNRQTDSLDGSFEGPSASDPPPKPQTALQLFVTSVRDKLEMQSKSRHITANAYGHIVKSWKKQPEKERIVFIRRAMDFWKDYEEKAKEYQKTNPRYRPFPCTVTKEERALLDKVSGKPARPAGSPYVMFLQDTLPTLKQHQPKNRMAVVSRMWGELEEEKKAVYQEKFSEVQKEYRQKLVNYELKPLCNAAKRKREDSPGTSESTSSTTPTIASNEAFTFFSKMVGPALQTKDGDPNTLPKRLSETWEGLTPEEKSIYESQMRTSAAVGKGATNIFTTASVSSDPGEAEKVHQRIARQLMAGAPKKPPSCAYHLFLRETYPKLTDLPQKERTRLLAKHWTNFPAEAKKPFALRTAEMQREYEGLFAEFLETIPPETREIVRNKAMTKRRHRRASGRMVKSTEEGAVDEVRSDLATVNGEVAGDRNTPASIAASSGMSFGDEEGDFGLEDGEECNDGEDGSARLKISIGGLYDGSGSRGSHIYSSDTETESGEE